MITPEYVQTMARYALWQNESVFSAADSLTEAQRREDRGAFFGSIHHTLNHLLWGDHIWMHRFAGPRHRKRRPFRNRSNRSRPGKSSKPRVFPSIV